MKGFIRVTAPLSASPSVPDGESRSRIVGYIIPYDNEKGGSYSVGMSSFLAALKAAAGQEPASHYKSNNNTITAVVVDGACCEVLSPCDELYDELQAAKHVAVGSEEYEYAAVLRDGTDSFHIVLAQV